MDAAAGDAAAAPPDLENGGGAVATRPCPADRRLKENQPFTWLGAAPYIAVVLVGAALVAVGLAVDAKQGQGQPDQISTVGGVIYTSGVVVVAVGLIAAAMAADEGCCDCNPRRFGTD